MIGLDTNVLVRYFVRDDPEQTRRATTVMEGSLSSESPGFINLVTIVELNWVLERNYKLPSSKIIDVLRELLSNEAICVQNELEVHIAYRALIDGHGFADALIAALNTSSGCTKTFTFDRKAARLPGFQLI